MTDEFFNYNYSPNNTTDPEDDVFPAFPPNYGAVRAGSTTIGGGYTTDIAHSQYNVNYQIGQSQYPISTFNTVADPTQAYPDKEGTGSTLSFTGTNTAQLTLGNISPTELPRTLTFDVTNGGQIVDVVQVIVR